uniref:Uncharacterized protein n=1 Tax=Arundo donax TaxID=35708 RepID=A0A0A9AKC8_ARUDO
MRMKVLPSTIASHIDQPKSIFDQNHLSCMFFNALCISIEPVDTYGFEN